MTLPGNFKRKKKIEKQRRKKIKNDQYKFFSTEFQIITQPNRIRPKVAN